jgi:nucleotide-binding universal stress UspA family protein
VLPAVGAIAREEGARIRLLRVSAPPPAVEAGDRVIAYADQETARVELEGLAYLKNLTELLPGATVDLVVRFGDSVEKIVEEAESSGADLIAMATHDRTGIAWLRWGSVTDAVAGATRIPVMRVAARVEETADVGLKMG